MIIGLMAMGKRWVKRMLIDPVVELKYDLKKEVRDRKKFQKKIEKKIDANEMKAKLERTKQINERIRVGSDEDANAMEVTQ